MMKKWLTYASVLILALFLAACGSSDEEEEAQELPIQSDMEPIEVTDEELMPAEDIVLEVEGQGITGEEYNRTYQQTKVFLASIQEDITDLDDLKEKTLETIVHQTLLTQDAASKGIEVTDDEFDEEFNTIKDGNEDALTLYLQQFQMTEDDYKEQLRYSMMYRKYVEQEYADIDVSDEEVESVYNDIKATSDNIPDLDEIHADLKQELIDQQVRQDITEHIDRMKDEATIVEYI